jgi:hypothetical protein
MKLKAFLQRVPEPFAVELLEALPAPDRRELLRRHGAKVALTAGSLKRASRIAKEARLLVQHLLRSEDPDETRTFLQGWIARRAEMVVHFLDAWKVKHQGGIVDDFGWVETLPAETVKASLEGLDPKLEPIAPLVYFAYLELPVTEQVLDVDALFKGLEQQQAPSS